MHTGTVATVGPAMRSRNNEKFRDMTWDATNIVTGIIDVPSFSWKKRPAWMPAFRNMSRFSILEDEIPVGCLGSMRISTMLRDGSTSTPCMQMLWIWKFVRYCTCPSAHAGSYTQIILKVYLDASAETIVFSDLVLGRIRGDVNNTEYRISRLDQLRETPQKL